MGLPVKTSAEDAIQIVKFLQEENKTCSIEYAIRKIDKRLLDPRKINAYIAWGIIERDENVLALTDRGDDLADAQDVQYVFRDILREVAPYHDVIEWIAEREDCLYIYAKDIIDYWRTAKKEEVSDESDNSLKDRVICLFRICEAARLGKLIPGRKGGTPYFEVNKSEISRYLEKDIVEMEGKEIRTGKEIHTYLNEEGDKEQMKADILSFPIPCKDGKMASLNLPKNLTDDEAKYVFEMLRLILQMQFNLNY